MEQLLAGVTLERSDEALIIRAREPLQLLSTAVLGGGRRVARTILNFHVPKGYDCVHPNAICAPSRATARCVRRSSAS